MTAPTDNAKIERAYSTISEWKLNPLELIVVAGRLCKDGIEQVGDLATGAMNTGTSFDADSDNTGAPMHLGARASDAKRGMTFGELVQFVDLASSQGTPDGAGVTVTVGFSRQIKAIDTTDVTP